MPNTNYRVLLPCLMGLEAPLRDEVYQAAFPEERVITDDAQVAICCESIEEAARAAARMNFRSRCAERVLLELGRFPAADYDALFDGCLALPWEEWLERGAAVQLKGYSCRSKVYGIPSCQRVLKKALARRLIEKWEIPGGLLPEDNSRGVYQLHFAIIDDICSISLDTTGDGLHKRGYRPLKVLAPIRETLAAAMLQLSLFPREASFGECLLDPCCGSGTFGIEAALLLSGRAPGLKRHFAGEKLSLLGQAVFDREREYAKLEIKELAAPVAYLMDLDPDALEATQQNARRAGVEELLRFRQADLRSLKAPELNAFAPEKLLIMTNPPYGERLMDEKTADDVLRALGRLALPGGKLRSACRLSVITPRAKAEELLGARADKRRKLYNGMIPCTLYHYFRRPVPERKKNGRL